MKAKINNDGIENIPKDVHDVLLSQWTTAEEFNLVTQFANDTITVYEEI